MTDNVARVSRLPIVQVEKAAVSLPQPSEPRNDNADESRYRLSIEAVGPFRYVYKVVDRVTGEVIRQLPREEVEKLITDPTYRDGQLLNTLA